MTCLCLPDNRDGCFGIYADDIVEAGGSLLGGLAFCEEPFATLSDDSLQISFQLGVGASVTGVAATGSVGSVTVNADANVSVTGVAGTGQNGSITIDGDAIVAVTGLAGTSGVGAVTVTQAQASMLRLARVSVRTGWRCHSRLET